MPGNPLRVISGHKANIAYRSGNIPMFEGVVNFAQYVRLRVKIIGIDHADDIAGGQSNAFVHGVVDTAVGLRDNFGDVWEFLDDVQGMVLAIAVYDNVLHIRVVLCCHALQGVAYGFGAVVSDGYDGYSRDNGVKLKI